MSIDLVCTIGPASSAPDILKELLMNGMNIARLNLSHGNHDAHEQVIKSLRAVSTELGIPVRILGDIQGPKIRLNNIQGDSVELKIGQTFVLDHSSEPGSKDRAALDNPEVMDAILPGADILINDGEVRLRVSEVNAERIITQVIVGGIIASHKGVNLPGTKLTLPVVTDKDKLDLPFLIHQGVDLLACSFIREASNILEIREIISKMDIDHIPGIIAKLETLQGVLNFRAIANVSDGIMIARGDLGVELPFEQIPFIQKALLNECKKTGKYTITATQMLHSMVEHPVPTRAEVTDVSQAVIDGTDAVMLSAESSVGQFPVQCAKVLGTIADFAMQASGDIENGYTLDKLYETSWFKLNA